MGTPRGSDWDKILKSLPLYNECPPGYLTITEFSKRAGASGPSILKAIRAGKIARHHCVALAGKKSTRKVIINWNAAGYSFIVNRSKAWWPKDFAINDNRAYKLFDMADVAEEDIVKAPNQGVGADADYEAVTDIASAKYRVEQLKIAKMQAELKLANNEVVPIEKVMAHERELALEIKASIRKAENKMAPLLAQANTVLECRAILEAYHREAFEALQLLESSNGATEKISSN